MKAKFRNRKRIEHNSYSRRAVKAAKPNRLENLKALGAHVLVEMHDCFVEKLDDVDWVEQVMVEAARKAHARIVNSVFHKFNPVGISGVVVIAESHIAIHIWPEYRYAALDIFSCSSEFKVSAAVSFVTEQFRCVRPSVTEVRRGLLSALDGRERGAVKRPRNASKGDRGAPLGLRKAEIFHAGELT